jgi:hypothetical protein
MIEENVDMEFEELIAELIERASYSRVVEVIQLYQKGDVLEAVKTLEVAFPELAGLSRYVKSGPSENV